MAQMAKVEEASFQAGGLESPPAGKIA